MNFKAQTMTQAMTELVTISGVVNDRSRGQVRFLSVDADLDLVQRCCLRGQHYFEDFLKSLVGRLAKKECAGQIAVVAV